MPENTVIRESLDDREVRTIAHCLGIAAERFDEHAVEFNNLAASLRAGHKMPLFAEGEPGARAAEKLQQQFEMQARDARAVRDRIEYALDVTFESEAW